jgi:type I restriction enzyme S subunit
LNYQNGSAKNIHYGDVLIKFGELLDLQKDDIPYINENVLIKQSNSSRLKVGDIIIADAAEDETVGKCTELVNIEHQIVFSGLHTIPSRPVLNFASGYLGFFINSSLFHSQLLRLMQGTKVSSISKSSLQNTDIYFPLNVDEQLQISKLLQDINNLITLHQRKLDKLENIKKSLLDKMFV